MTIREYIIEKCYQCDVKKFIKNALRTEEEIREYYKNQTDASLILLYESYFGSGSLLNLGMNNMVKTEDRCEFVGQIMDVIEDGLREKGISFPDNKQLMREAGCSEEEIEENDVILYGENYDMFADPIADVLSRWKVLEEF